ncbi:MAG: hypothetical protein WCS98_05270 [Bacillota bacterium]|nr:hypothetical protein [Bacillota bacterium]MDD3298595.1 hypothetical protein [Bacillota bacterium]MDD3850952.1 hypothetical protein [Bacillota bacterium]MDD4708277.1 hypothetical protein [Bacillota bacterium]
MRTVKVLLVIFFIIALVAGYIIYNSSMSVSIAFKAPVGNDTVEQDEPPAASGTINTESMTAPTDKEESPAPDVVKRIHDLFQSLDADGREGFQEILDALPDIDWCLYSKEYGTVADNGIGALDLLERLTDNPLTVQGSNMLKVFKATKGLDGVLTEQYSIIVGDFFRSDIEKYVKLLSELDEQSIEKVCSQTAYNNYYHAQPEETIESITARFEDRSLSNKEMYVLETLTKAIGAYITEEST